MSVDTGTTLPAAIVTAENGLQVRTAARVAGQATSGRGRPRSLWSGDGSIWIGPVEIRPKRAKSAEISANRPLWAQLKRPGSGPLLA